MVFLDRMAPAHNCRTPQRQQCHVQVMHTSSKDPGHNICWMGTYQGKSSYCLTVRMHNRQAAAGPQDGFAGVRLASCSICAKLKHVLTASSSYHGKTSMHDEDECAHDGQEEGVHTLLDTTNARTQLVTEC